MRAFRNFDELQVARSSAPARKPGTSRPTVPKTVPAKTIAAQRSQRKLREKLPRLNPTEQRLGRGLVFALGAVVAIMLGISLQHLASGIREITHSTGWSAWSLAIAIAVGMVASEIALIVLATFPNIQVAGYAHRYVISTIAISNALNVWAFWPTNGDTAVIGVTLAVFLGAGIPLGVYHLTRVAGRIWQATANRIAPA